MRDTDLLIVGGGPAGLSAAINAASEGLRVTLWDKATEVGGQARHSSKIENFMGFPRGLSGQSLTQRAVRQAQRFGARISTNTQASLYGHDGERVWVRASNGTETNTRALLVASGLAWRKHPAQGIDALTGRGCYYGASAHDAELTAKKHVGVVGGANSAGQAALHFSRFAAHVSLIVRADSLSKGMSHYLVERIIRTRNITTLLNTSVSRVAGDPLTARLDSVTLSGQHSGQLNAQCLFLFIGAEPQTAWLSVEKDQHGYLQTDSSYRANAPGIFAAGDTRSGNTKRVATAVGEGAAAVSAILRYISTHSLAA